MSASTTNDAAVLQLTLHGVLVGYLAGFTQGRNVLSFAESFQDNLERPTFSLITHPKTTTAANIMSEPWARRQRLHPVLSNLLPEGVLRELVAQALKVHVDNEFHILSRLGKDLPGAIVASPMDPEQVPDHVLNSHGKGRAIKFEDTVQENRFSLAGVQMKFSMKEMDGRYNLATDNELGDWIVKTPSTKHKFVPLNEYTAMRLAQMTGVDIPEIKLVEMSQIDSLPQINLPDEQFAFAIKRFDREGNQRIHMEDFAQVMVKYPHEKYSSANYENIGSIVYNYSGDGLADVQQFARRLLVNILLANGDAHLKNWSFSYPDAITPRLSLAYDIVTTRVYIESESRYALNMASTKEWYEVSMNHFQSWATRVGIPWRAIVPHLSETLSLARELWPEALKGMPMDEGQKDGLRAHWRQLHEDFRIAC
ncbi:MAG: type II toxin-antitoxin system HipA family toxin [Granulosicoccus sp.]